VILVAFVVWESRVPAPLMPLGIFRHRNLSVANVVGILWAAVTPGGAVWAGSGKSVTPCARMHSANLSAACRSLGDIRGSWPLAGRSVFHACWADWKAGD
jgi:hypothetical protein